MISAELRPTIGQRLLRIAGRLPIPKIEGLYWKLGALSCATPRHFTVRFAGLKYQGCLDQHIDRRIYFFGAYAPAELDFLDRAAQILRGKLNMLTFVDIGANVGQHSLFMAGRANRVVAFEPNDEAANQFEENLCLNGLNNVEVFRYALGCEDGNGELGSGFDGNNGSRSLTWSLDHSKNTMVRIRQADRVLTELQVNCVDLLKIDVEGYEKNVLAGLASTLRRDRPVTLFELVGLDVKGGFRSEAELREALYDDHCLFTLTGARRARLAPFDWAHEQAVCIPREIVDRFGSLIRADVQRR